MSQTLNLDKRQRAMLREMGVRVWQPLTQVPTAAAVLPAKPGLEVANSAPASALAAASAPVHPVVATNSVATSARIKSSKSTFVPQPVATQPPLPPQTDVRSDGSAVYWSVGGALALYTQATPVQGPCWLVLAETPAAALQPEPLHADSPFNPFEGDAGKLLDNMLRAVRLHKTGNVMLAPVVRRVGVEAMPEPGLPADLASLMQAVQPDVVLVMGRLAAQALLQSSEPFGKLRGQVHSLHGARTVVTHDAAYLLRSPLEKARAWEDLCLAMSVVQPL